MNAQEVSAWQIRLRSLPLIQPESRIHMCCCSLPQGKSTQAATLGEIILFVCMEDSKVPTTHQYIYFRCPKELGLDLFLIIKVCNIHSLISSLTNCMTVSAAESPCIVFGKSEAYPRHISGAGHIVTNFHVIRGASNIKVALIDQSVYPATVSHPHPSTSIENVLCLGNMPISKGWHQCLTVQEVQLPIMAEHTRTYANG